VSLQLSPAASIRQRHLSAVVDAEIVHLGLQAVAERRDDLSTRKSTRDLCVSLSLLEANSVMGVNITAEC